MGDRLASATLIMRLAVSATMAHRAASGGGATGTERRGEGHGECRHVVAYAEWIDPTAHSRRRARRQTILRDNAAVSQNDEPLENRPIRRLTRDEVFACPRFAVVR